MNRVGINQSVSWLTAGWKTGFRFLAIAGTFFFITTFIWNLVSSKPGVHWVPWAVFTGVKQSEGGLKSRSDVNAWNFTATVLDTCMVYCWLKIEDNFTSLLFQICGCYLVLFQRSTGMRFLWMSDCTWHRT